MKTIRVLTLAAVLACMGAWAQQPTQPPQPATPVSSDAERLEKHFKGEMNELREYLSEMMSRQSELAELVKSMAESGKEAAGEAAKELLEDAELTIKQQRAEMQENLQRIQAEMRAKEIATRALEEDARARAEEARRREEEASQPVSRVINVEYAPIESILTVLQPLFAIDISADPQTGVIGMSGPASSVTAFCDAVALLDVPRPAVKNVELRIHLLGASKNANAISASMGEGMEEVIESLSGVFPYQDWGLLETAYVRCRDGEAARVSGNFSAATGSPAGETSGGGFGGGGYGGGEGGYGGAPGTGGPGEATYGTGGMPGGIGGASPFGGESVYGPAPAGARYEYDLASQSVRVDPKTNGIALDVLELRLKSPDGPAQIKVDIDLEDGQRAVVGKASMTGGLDAVFLVISAKIL